MGTRIRHSYSGTDGSRRKSHRRLNDVEQSGPENMIQATTVVVVEDYPTKGGFVVSRGGGRGGDDTATAGSTPQGDRTRHPYEGLDKRKSVVVNSEKSDDARGRLRRQVGDEIHSMFSMCKMLTFVAHQRVLLKTSTFFFCVS